MKSIEEIKEKLYARLISKKNARYDSDEYYWAGYIEALEWVLESEEDK